MNLLGTVGSVLMLTACATGPSRVAENTATSMQSSEVGPAIVDFQTLVRTARLIIVGRVTAAGTTLQIPQPPQTPIVSKAPVAGQPARTGTSSSTGISVPITKYPVKVEQVVRGTGLSLGSTVTLSISGNPIAGAPPSKDDAPLANSERYVLFLQRADDGSYFPVGGLQGRISIDAAEKIHSAGPATQAHEGQALTAFVSDINAVK